MIMFKKIPNREKIAGMDFSGLKEPVGSSPGKRILDTVTAAVSLIMLSPFLLLIVLAIRLDSRGPAIFTHTRVGKDGKPFKFYKFRTMKSGVAAQEFAPARKGDPRVTRVGKLLRRTSMDELPQLWNVLKGDMSIVGPRPEMEFIVKKYTPEQRRRLLVKPGITGLWQVMGRKDIPLHENAEYDYYYIMHRGPLLDLQIILKTIIVVISGKGAY